MGAPRKSMAFIILLRYIPIRASNLRCRAAVMPIWSGGRTESMGKTAPMQKSLLVTLLLCLLPAGCSRHYYPGITGPDPVPGDRPDHDRGPVRDRRPGLFSPSVMLQHGDYSLWSCLMPKYIDDPGWRGSYLTVGLGRRLP
jgi:hypothetical protein